MITYKCSKCGKDITGVKVKHMYTQMFDDCSCGGHSLTIPLEHYDDLNDVKCPYCNEYPFENKPMYESKYIKLVIDVERE